MSTRRLWVYKWNEKGQFHAGRVRNWEAVFSSSEECEGYGFDSPLGGRALLDVKVGDIFVAYQTDRRAAIGVCEITAVQKDAPQPHVRFIARHRFPSPVKLHELKRSEQKLREVDALKQGLVQSLYKLTDSESRVVLNACGLSDKNIEELLQSPEA